MSMNIQGTVNGLLQSLSSQELSVVDAYLTERELELQRIQCRNSFWYFITTVLDYPLLYEPLHKPLCDDLQRYNRFTLYLLPREHLKSTIISVAYPLWLLVVDPDNTIMLGHAVSRLSQKYLEEIRGNMQLANFKRLFPEYSLATDSKTEIVLRNRIHKRKEPNISITGIEKVETSQHPKYIILDDLVTEQNVSSVNLLEKTQKVIGECLRLMKKLDDARLIIVGTRWHHLDAYGRILDEDNHLVRSVNGKVLDEHGLYSCWVRTLTEDGKLHTDSRGYPEVGLNKYIFPNYWNDDRVKELLPPHMSHYQFMCNYFNTPVSDETALIKPEWFKFYDQPPARLNVFITVDPAISVDVKADYTGIVVVGIDSNNDWYVLETIREHIPPDDIGNVILSVLQRYHPVKVGIEAEGFQKMISYDLKRKMKETGCYFTITPLKSERTPDAKTKRVLSVAPLLKQGVIFFKKDQIALQKQLIDIGSLGACIKGGDDDLADALGYMTQLVYPKSKEVMEKMTYHKRQLQLAKRHQRELTRWTGKPQPLRINA